MGVRDNHLQARAGALCRSWRSNIIRCGRDSHSHITCPCCCPGCCTLIADFPATHTIVWRLPYWDPCWPLCDASHVGWCSGISTRHTSVGMPNTRRPFCGTRDVGARCFAAKSTPQVERYGMVASRSSARYVLQRATSDQPSSTPGCETQPKGLQ